MCVYLNYVNEKRKKKTKKIRDDHDSMRGIHTFQRFSFRVQLVETVIIGKTNAINDEEMKENKKKKNKIIPLNSFHMY